MRLARAKVVTGKTLSEFRFYGLNKRENAEARGNEKKNKTKQAWKKNKQA